MFRLVLLTCLLLSSLSVEAGELPRVYGVEVQPLKAQVKRLHQTLEYLGEPLSEQQQNDLKTAFAMTDDVDVSEAIQDVLDPLCLAGVNINAESRVKGERGPAKAELTRHGWRVFLVKVHNEAGVTAALRVNSPNAAAQFRRSTAAKEPRQDISDSDVQARWMNIASYERQPLLKNLSGLPLEYRIIQIYSRDQGKREAKLLFDVGQGTQDIGFRNELPVLFECLPAVAVTLEVIDDDGKPTTGQFIFKDKHDRVYPALSRRLEPDFYFHEQVYRHHNEVIHLPPGEFTVIYTRGPEYHKSIRQIVVPEASEHRERFRLKRWIKLTDHHWYSGDHHVHAAGCKHYEAPTQGVSPESMMRHILGEDLNVGCVLSWGPCWYHQKQFFEGKVHALSRKNYLMRYDVEVSGFPSSHAGHLCLLRLQEDDYPGTTRIDQWPSWNAPILKWGKEQGGVVGYSHSGWGLKVSGDKLPIYEIPPYDGIGANEYVVDVTQGLCDFISTVDTPSTWELNIWYHTLNCGYTCRISGETDFPCIYGDRVGLGRSYVKLDPKEELTFDRWAAGIKDGKCYVSDGMSHLFDFKVNNLEVGSAGETGEPSLLHIGSNETIDVSVKVAAMLSDEVNEEIRKKPLDQKPFWHLERARIGNSKNVPVELIVNGQAVATKNVLADGSINDLKFNYPLQRSSWVAVRIFPSSHTNPIFVKVDGQPIRASLKSAKWCIDSVERCWNSKKKLIRESELDEAKKMFDEAKGAYQVIASQSFDDR